ncbi:MAG: DUF5711 family protein [Clostridium sp.]|nr:DUF5711 family protein [Clostridium sp.]MCM1399618.1 DUF5711 family protein [Clostridium sp.]MCM1460478.1 DUF5711 family protein [Bacteroides sp.]
MGRNVRNNLDNQPDNVVRVRGSKEVAEANREIANNVRRQKRNLFFVLLIIVIIAAVVIILMLNKEYSGYKVESRNDTSYENTAAYVQFCGNLLKYTPDGVSYINANGDTVWTAGVDMKMPIAATSGSYAVVADMSGNELYIFNEEGQVSNLTMPYTICDVDVASQGAFAVVLESDTTNYINLYDKNGESVYTMKTTISKSGYPLDIAISDDGQKLFSSYINVGGSTVQNNLAAYNFGDVGQNANADRMVGGYKFENEVIPKVEFIDNDTVVAFGTNTITIYSMREKPSERAKIELDAEIRSIFYNKDYIGIIQDAEPRDGEKQYKLTTYDLKGNKKFGKNIGFGYDNIYAADKEIIISGGSNCLIVRTNGRVKFEGGLSGKVVGVVPSGKRNEYVVVYDNATEIIKLKSESNDEPEDKETVNKKDSGE